MRKLLEAIMRENNAEHSYSSTQINLPQEVAKEALKFSLAIPDDQIYIDPDNPSYGRELEPHITIKYGLTTVSPEDVIELLPDGLQKFVIRLGNISLFTADDKPYDVVKVDIESAELRELNSVFSTLENDDSHLEYVPHMTIAYVKKGHGKEYDGRDDLAGQEFEVDSFEFKGSNDVDTEIPLNENLVDFGKGELSRVGLLDEDSDYEGMIGVAVLELLDAFAKQGHSGCSADITRSIFDKLARFEPLSPITDSKDEWLDVTEYGDPNSPLWQCQRNPACFSTDGGKTHYHVDKPKDIKTSEKSGKTT